MYNTDFVIFFSVLLLSLLLFIILFCPAQFGSICLSLFRALSLSHACQVRLGDLIPLDSSLNSS